MVVPIRRAPFGARGSGRAVFRRDIKTHQCEVVAVIQGKEIVHGVGVRYSASFRNNGPAIAAFNFRVGASTLLPSTTR